MMVFDLGLGYDGTLNRKLFRIEGQWIKESEIYQYQEGCEGGREVVDYKVRKEN